MEFRIADTFTASLARLTGNEQKTVKTTAFDLQTNPSNPGLRFHRLDKARDPNFWSISASLDIRLIVHKTESSILLCYVDHHDKAYAWAQRRKVETHPKTGAAQLVEIRETIEEITIPKYAEIDKPKLYLLSDKTNDELLSYGVPSEWLEDVKNANEDTILELADHLPNEAAEAILDIAIGRTPQIATVCISSNNSFDHPDAKRRFRVMSNVEDLERALEFPWEKWSVFLHPEQQQIIERNYNGPARVSGSAGTGKTIVALHRAVYLARNNPDARVLLTTFSDTLANALRNKLKVLLYHTPRIGERLEVYSMDDIGKRLYKLNIKDFNIATYKKLQRIIETSAAEVNDHKFSSNFLYSEWTHVVDAWQLKTWEDYRDVARLGRKTRLPEKQREILWSIFKRVRAGLEENKIITYSDLFSQLAEKMSGMRSKPFDFIVIDEAQDINVAQLRFLSSLGAVRDNGLFFAGDLGQRIFQQPFSWKSLGVDIRGRSQTLKINYRTSHQIRMQADRLLGPEISDVDGNIEDRRGTISVFNGPKPDIQVLNSDNEEIKLTSDWILSRAKEGVKPHEIGVFVRSTRELDRAKKAVKKASLSFKVIEEVVETTNDTVSIGTMHLAKGMEFKAVAVMACDDEIIPLQQRIEAVTDDADLEEVYNTERHLLYVACTRARDYLLVTGVKPGSEFIDDLQL